MTSNLLDISDKIDKSLADLFDILTQVTGKLGIPFFVVGATARDLVLRFYDETPARATRDVDIGIRIAEKTEPSPNSKLFRSRKNPTGPTPR